MYDKDVRFDGTITSVKFGLLDRSSGKLARAEKTLNGLRLVDVEDETRPVLEASLQTVLDCVDLGAGSQLCWEWTRTRKPDFQDYDLVGFLKEERFVKGIASPVSTHTEIGRVTKPDIRLDIRAARTRDLRHTPPKRLEKLFGLSWQERYSIGIGGLFEVTKSDQSESLKAGDIIVADWAYQRVAAVIDLPDDWPMSGLDFDAASDRFLILTDQAALVLDHQLEAFEPEESTGMRLR